MYNKPITSSINRILFSLKYFSTHLDQLFLCTTKRTPKGSLYNNLREDFKYENL
nr:MAG TPA: hypothetical protein [Caudoviricetes sp.]